MNGLNNNEVEIARKKYGSNDLVINKKNSFWKLLIESLGDPIIKILLIALAIKIVFLFKNFDWYETIGILIAIFLASFISSISEYGSEKAFLKLQEESSKIKCKVLRDGVKKIVNIEDIVVGDLVVLSSGDKIPADGIILKGNISVDESAINGESIEKNKLSNDKCFRGCVVINGYAIFKVLKVGLNTLYGQIFQDLQEKSPDSPMKSRLRQLAKVISKIGYIGAVLVTISYLFSEIVIKNNFDSSKIMATITNFPLLFNYILYALTLCVTVIVVAVPEGLPMMITLVLSSNVKKMLKNNVLVRKMVGIETAGSLNVLLSDKTGTITKGKMEAIGYITPFLETYKNINELKKYDELYKLIVYSAIYNNEADFDDMNNVIGGNITDQSILKFIGNKSFIKHKVISSVLFNSKNKYSKVTVDMNNSKISFIKGASEVIIPKCTYAYNKFGKKTIFNNKENVIENIKLYTEKGIRVISFAIEERNNYSFLGFILLKDEIKEDAKVGIDLVKKAGIQTIMITGDAYDTALSIAKEINLYNNEDNDIILDSENLNKLSDYEIKNIFPKLRVVARALPSDKARLVSIAQELNLVVGMTGDGVNDAPALKKCDVGFSMGSGTEVAKEASDIIILDDNFLSISKAVLFGRTIFKSIRKFIIFQLTVNMCALILSIIGPFIGINTPITIMQMLWINMIMDTFAGVAFSFEAPLKEYMYEEPKRKDEPIISKYMYNQIIITGLYSSLICILFLKLPIFKSFIRIGNNNKYLLTAYFALFIFIGIFNAFNARTDRINIFANLRKNKIFIIIFGLIFIVQLYLIYFGGSLFRTYGINMLEFIIVLLLSLTVIPFDMIRKYFFKYKKFKH